MNARARKRTIVKPTMVEQFERVAGHTRFIPDLIVTDAALEMRNDKANVVRITADLVVALERSSARAQSCSYPQVKNNSHTIGDVFRYDTINLLRDRL